MSREVKVVRLPKCDFHPNEDHPAEYDFKTSQGPWGNGCREAWVLNRAYDTLGTGKGQHLVLEEG
jgi:hypothetical protein